MMNGSGGGMVTMQLKGELDDVLVCLDAPCGFLQDVRGGGFGFSLMGFRAARDPLVETIAVP